MGKFLKNPYIEGIEGRWHKVVIQINGFENEYISEYTAKTDTDKINVEYIDERMNVVVSGNIVDYLIMFETHDVHINVSDIPPVHSGVVSAIEMDISPDGEAEEGQKYDDIIIYLYI